MAITRRGPYIFGLAADTKPLPSLTELGLEFVETNTHRKYVNDGTSWVLLDSSGVDTVADGGTISHGLETTPVWALAMATVAGEFASVTSITSTTLTIALKRVTGGSTQPGTTQTVYWKVGAYL